MLVGLDQQVLARAAPWQRDWLSEQLELIAYGRYEHCRATVAGQHRLAAGGAGAGAVARDPAPPNLRRRRAVAGQPDPREEDRPPCLSPTSTCPNGCDANGFLFDEERRQAYPCSCREERLRRRLHGDMEASVGRYAPPRFQDLDWGALPLSGIAERHGAAATVVRRYTGRDRAERPLGPRPVAAGQQGHGQDDARLLRRPAGARGRRVGADAQHHRLAQRAARQLQARRAADDAPDHRRDHPRRAAAPRGRRRPAPQRLGAGAALHDRQPPLRAQQGHRLHQRHALRRAAGPGRAGRPHRRADLLAADADGRRPDPR